MSSTILGIRIDDFTVEETLKKAESFLLSGGQHLIFTPNPEMIVKSRTDLKFREVLRSGSINICDGAGLALALRLRGKRVERITGVDFMVELCAVAEQKNYSVYLLGGGNAEVVKKTKENLLKKFPDLKISGCDSGPVIDEAKIMDDNLSAECLQKINLAKPDILFVAFGMGKQEKWLAENLSKMPSVKIGMGVGGAFDYLSGLVPRAPRLMRQIGLEWLYRLWKQPKRFGRILNATLKFSYLVLTERI